MTLINDSKSFSFFEFLDYDLLEKERTEIRHLIFKKDLIIVPRDRNNAQDCIIEGYRFTMMKIETEIILGSCASESEKTREKISDALLRMIPIHCCKNRDHYVYE